MSEISTKKTVDEQILERLQALEVLLMEQRKEIDELNRIIALNKKWNNHFITEGI